MVSGIRLKSLAPSKLSSYGFFPSDWQCHFPISSLSYWLIIDFHLECEEAYDHNDAFYHLLALVLYYNFGWMILQVEMMMTNQNSGLVEAKCKNNKLVMSKIFIGVNGGAFSVVGRQKECETDDGIVIK
jgi:hypothetical protein